MLFDVATQKWSELTKINNGYANWSRDGKYIYLDTLLGNEWVSAVSGLAITSLSR